MFLKKALEEMVAAGCPCCGEQDDERPLFFSSKCCATNKLEVSYLKGGTVLVDCGACGTPVGTFKVAEE